MNYRRWQLGDGGQEDDEASCEPEDLGGAGAWVAGLAALGGVLGGEEALEVDRGGRGEQLQLDEPGAAASRAVSAVALELGDRAFGVGLAIDRGGAAGRGKHPFVGGRSGRVLGARLRRDERRRVELGERRVAGLAGVAAIGRDLGDRVAGPAGPRHQITQAVGF